MMQQPPNGGATAQNPMYIALLNQGYNPAQIEQIMALGMMPEQLKQIQEKREFYEPHLEADIGRGIYDHRGFTAQSPLKVIGELGKQWIAQQKMKELDEQAGKIGQEQVDARLAFLRGQGRGMVPRNNARGLAGALRGPAGGPPRFVGKGTSGV